MTKHLVVMYSRLTRAPARKLTLANFPLHYEAHESEVKQRRLFKRIALRGKR